MRCPNLAMRMRIARAHHFAAVFKYLDVLNVWHGRKLHELCGPCANHVFNFRYAHARDRQVMPRRKAHHATDSRLALSYEQPFVLHVNASCRRFVLQGSEVTLEYKCSVALRFVNVSCS